MYENDIWKLSGYIAGGEMEEGNRFFLDCEKTRSSESLAVKTTCFFFVFFNHLEPREEICQNI